MKKFFQEFKRSLHDWAWYKEIGSGNYPLSLKYAGGLAILGSLILTIFITVGIYVAAVPTARVAIPELIPEDLIITLKSGELSINQPVPYSIPVPAEAKDAMRKEGGARSNILVIDTTAAAVLDSPGRSDAYAFVNKDTLVVEDENGGVRAFPLKNSPDLTVSRDTAYSAVDKIAKYAWMLSVPLFVLIALVNFVGSMVIFAIAGGMLWAAMKFASRQIRYKSAFNVVVHAYTILFCVDVVLLLLGQGGFGPFASVILTFLLGSLFMFMNRRDISVVPDQDQPL